MQNVKENKMGTAKMLPLIISMSIPAMVSMLVQALYNIVDSVFVSRVSESALTAVSLAFPVQTLLIAFSVGSAVGVNSLVSRKLGERDRAAAESAANHGVVMALVLYVPFLLFGLFFAAPFGRAFAQTAATGEMCASYLQVVCICSVFVFVQIAFEKILQATGNMFWPMVMQLTGALVNIALDPVFIFGYFGVPAMGVTGAAVATVIGQGVAFIVSIAVIFFKEHEIKISLKGFRFSGATLRSIYSVGVPAMVMQAIGSVMTMCMNMVLGGFNETAVAVFGVYFKVQSFVFLPVIGMTSGVMPIMGYNFGARNKKRLMDALKYCLLIAVCIMVLGTLLFQLFPDKLLMIFGASDTMQEIGQVAFRAISTCFIPAALGITFSTLYQAVGHGVYSMILSVARQLLVLVPSAYILANTLGLNATWFAFPIAEVAAFVLALVLYARLKKTTFTLLDAPRN